jgi:3-(3-hydroxy-phenyl)propionate hydroxylase
MDDLAFDEPWLVVDAIVHDPARLPDINLQICDPARPTTCVLMGEGRHRWEFMILPGETPDDLLDDARIAALLAPWNVDGAVTLERKAVYRFNARVAKAWRQDRAFLAGDAAHQTPPFAGQGLCSGVRDAANLAWKLAAVAKGEAGPGLLDSYQAERDAPVRAIIGLAMMMGRTVCVTDPDAAATRDAEMLATRAAGRAPSSAAATAPLPGGCVLAEAPAAGHYFAQPVADGTRLDDVLGDGPWLIGACLREPAGLAHAGLTLVALDEPRIAAFRPALAAWLTATGAPAVLVRPDRYVFGAGEPDVLAAAWRRALTA